MNGFLNVYKEEGFTSHDVCAKLRGILKTKKIGHTGTLDPAASGVLPVCIGKTTKFSELLTDKKKTYEAVLLLGKTTDTLDCEGMVIEEREVNVSEEEIRNAAASFLGEQMQLPPMYSAIKQNGKKLYELAREGKEVAREPRRVVFFEIGVTETDIPRVRMRVTCSKGTYIRSLASDIGEKLGCGACLESLIRTASGIFRIEEAHKLAEIEEYAREGRIGDLMLPPDLLFSECPRVDCTADTDPAAHNGNVLEASALGLDQADTDLKKIRLFDSRGRIVGIYKYDKCRGLFRPEYMLYEEDR